MSLVEIHSVYLYISYKNCVGSLIFRRACVLTNCASYDTLAKLTTPGALYEIKTLLKTLQRYSEDTPQ